MCVKIEEVYFIILDRHAGIIEAIKIQQSGFTGDMSIHRFCL